MPVEMPGLDIGTGTGLLALMCAQRFTEAQITAVDIELTAIEAAQKNVVQSPWSDRVSVHHSDLQESWQICVRNRRFSCARVETHCSSGKIFATD